MIQQIGGGHTFTKREWPGGDSSLSLVPVIVKKTAGVHKTHVITRKKKIGASDPMSVRKQKSKSTRRRSSRNASAADPHSLEAVIARLELLEAELAATKNEFSQQIKRLSDHASKIDRRFKAIKFRRARKLSSHYSFSLMKKSRRRSNHIPQSPSTPIDVVSNSPKPTVLVGDGVTHNWVQYEHVFGIFPPQNTAQVCITQLLTGVLFLFYTLSRS